MKCLGIPVIEDPNFTAVSATLDPSRPWWPWRFERVPGICQSRGLFRHKKIVVGKQFRRCFSSREQQAILLHEVGHVRLNHIEERLKNSWKIIFRPRAFAALCVTQELQADTFAANCGYGADLATALSRLQSTSGSLHPHAVDRIARLLACSKG